MNISAIVPPHGLNASGFTKELAADTITVGTPLAARPAVRSKPAIKLRCLESVQPKRVEWLWPGFLAKGKVTLLFGNPGLGKSAISLDCAARITSGKCWPDGSPTEMGGVMLLAAEDEEDDTIVPRLDAMGAERSRLFVPDLEGEWFDIGRDSDALAELVREMPDMRLLIIDPITAYVGDRNIDKASQIRPVMQALATLASNANVAVLVVSHPSKAQDRSAVHSAIGSQAFVAVSRLVWQTVADADDHSRRLLLPVKANIAKDCGGFSYCVEVRDDQPTVAWGDQLSSSADDFGLTAQQRIDKLAEAAVRRVIGDGLPNERLNELVAGQLVQSGLNTAEAARAAKRVIAKSTSKKKLGMTGPWLRVIKSSKS